MKAEAAATGAGHCIRCGKSIALNPAAPYCPDCYRVWKRYENPDHKEARCHICGTAQATTLNKPVCYACFKQHRALFEREKVGLRTKAG